MKSPQDNWKNTPWASSVRQQYETDFSSYFLEGNLVSSSLEISEEREDFPRQINWNDPALICVVKKPSQKKVATEGLSSQPLNGW